MNTPERLAPLDTIALGQERDVVAARQHARSIAESLGFEYSDQIRIATAVSEIARNAFRYARGGQVVFAVDQDTGGLWVTVTDKGSGIPHLDQVLTSRYQSKTGMGMGIVGTKRLMDEFSIDATAQGTTVRFGKRLAASRSLDAAAVQRVAAHLARQHPSTPLDELTTQNKELMKTLQELRERKDELDRANAELQDTNRGVVALYAELDERADYLRRASELKSSFLSNMSHEFRTPLNSILALTRLLLDRIDGELTTEQEQQLRYIQRSAKELADMVDDLLDLAKVEAGRLEVKPKSFEVAELFGALRGMLRPLLAESSINLVFEPADEIPPLFTDEQKLSQILRNFISNAIKFTPQGEVRVSARVVGDNIEFAVADTGIGISESDQNIIFEEFAQVDSSMQRQLKGTGLGLPLARKLAELLSGSVELHSVVGMGSTFTLIVPATHPGTPVVTQTPLPSFDPARKLVLIVEDNQETAFVYARYLQGAGFETYAVETLESAREFLSRTRPAAIILDLMLRAETSWSLLRELRAEPDPIPVLVMSVSDDEHKAYGLGADGFLLKPFIPEDLIREISAMTSETMRPVVLLIDDNEVARYLLRQSLPEGQYEIVEARDGREGIRLAQEVKPSFIFLDYFMPDLNGVEVFRDLRAQPAFKDTPIVLHSTKPLDAADRAVLDEHNIAVFSKQSLTQPEAPNRLRELMTTMLAHARAEGATEHV